MPAFYWEGARWGVAGLWRGLRALAVDWVDGRVGLNVGQPGRFFTVWAVWVDIIWSLQDSCPGGGVAQIYYHREYLRKCLITWGKYFRWALKCKEV